jgi:NAD(P)-dependent dehydrogenase (short-subunit alcohol dehydrogenase family)
MTRSDSKVALVTGAAAGIGLATTERLLQLGWKVTIVDLNADAGKEQAVRLGDSTIFVQVDVTDYDQQASAFAETWKKWERLDFVFANAVSLIYVTSWVFHEAFNDATGTTDKFFDKRDAPIGSVSFNLLLTEATARHRHQTCRVLIPV